MDQEWIDWEKLKDEYTRPYSGMTDEESAITSCVSRLLDKIGSDIVQKYSSYAPIDTLFKIATTTAEKSMVKFLEGDATKVDTLSIYDSSKLQAKMKWDILLTLHTKCNSVRGITLD